MDSDMMISRSLKAITDRLRQTGDEAFSAYGLTGPQAGYLRDILDAGGSMSQKELERQAGVSHPTIVGVVSRLHEKGYVSIRTDPNDRRQRIITLTAKAVEATEDLRKGGVTMNELLLRGMTKEDKSELQRLLGIMETNLNGAS